ncbi:MAG: hypothetical protein R3F62_17345 [Planctomycetota bacterium]
MREINVRQRLPFELSSAQVADVVADSGNGRFELVGARIRALRAQRAGDPDPARAHGADDFAFAILEPGSASRSSRAG